MTARAREEASLGPDQHNGALARYFGVDLHKEQITWHCIALKTDGETERTTGKVAISRLESEFIPMLDSSNCYLIVEASCSTFFFYSLVEAHCTKAFVINPSAFRELYMTGRKTDRIDARKLADRLKYHVETGDPDDGFPEVFVPDNETLKIRKLVTTYKLLVKQMTQLKNQLTAVFRSKLIVGYEDILDDGIEKIESDPRLDNADRLMVRALAAAHASLRKEKDSIKQAILDIGVHRFRREARLLVSVSGVSVMGAVVFMLEPFLLANWRQDERDGEGKTV